MHKPIANYPNIEDRVKSDKPLWKIYYGDGSTFDSRQGRPEEAPSQNVCCIVYADKEHGRRIVHRWDWYYFKDGTDSPVWGADIHGLLDQLMSDKSRAVHGVKIGRTYEDNIFRAIMQRAHEDTDFEPKSATTTLERNEGIQ